MKYCEEILQKSLGHASREGMVIFGFVLDRQDRAVRVFSSQDEPLDDLLFNAKAAIRQMEQKDADPDA